MSGTPNHRPKDLIYKKPDYQNDSFASWLEKTLFTSIELGDLNLLHPNVLELLKANANAASPQGIGNVEEINVVAAINETWNETRRVLVRAIAMS